MPKKKTNNEFLNELKEINPKYSALEVYKNNHSKILFKCIVHNEEFYSTPKRILIGICSCPKCSSDNKRKRLLKTNEDFLQELKDKNIDVVPLEEYKGQNINILFECSCGDKWITTPERVLIGNHCKKCGYLNMQGKNNYFYNPNLTEEDRLNENKRYRNPRYLEFRDNCFKRDNYTCRITGIRSKGDIVVHHLNGFNWDKENRTNVDNGVTLNKKIHKKFHKLYGKGNNTKQQFLEFIENLYSKNKTTEKEYNSLRSQIEKIK